MVTDGVVVLYIDWCVLSDRYCISMEKIDRAIQRSEEKFFGECDPGNSALDSLWFLELMIPSVPVVVLFTKFDALRPLALAKLMPADLKLPLREKLSKAKPLMEEVFGEANIWGRLSKMTYPPKSSIRIECQSHTSLVLAGSYYSLFIRHAQVKWGIQRFAGSHYSCSEWRTTANAVGFGTGDQSSTLRQICNKRVCLYEISSSSMVSYISFE